MMLSFLESRYSLLLSSTGTDEGLYSLWRRLMNLESSSLIQICSILLLEISLYSLLLLINSHAVQTLITPSLQLPTKQPLTSLLPPFIQQMVPYSLTEAAHSMYIRIQLSINQQAQQQPFRTGMSLHLQQPLKINRQHPNEEISKNTEPLLRHTRLMSNLSNTCITKTISNCFLLPEKIPKALEERQFFKSTATRPFFTKNMKMVETNKKGKKGRSSQSINMGMAATANDFTQILKAKSTVIKQKKLKEFYINREGRKQAEEIINYQALDFKSNLFKPNFPKKTRTRRNSLYVALKPTESIDIPRERLKIQRKTITISEFPTIEHEDCALKEKEQLFNNVLNKLSSNKRELKASNLIGKQRLPWKQRRRQKENLQFELEPWENNESDDIYF